MPSLRFLLFKSLWSVCTVLIEYSCHEYLTCFLALMQQMSLTTLRGVFTQSGLLALSPTVWRPPSNYSSADCLFLPTNEWVSVEFEGKKTANQCKTGLDLRALWRNLFRRVHLIKGYLLIPQRLANNFPECLAMSVSAHHRSHLLPPPTLTPDV